MISRREFAGSMLASAALRAADDGLAWASIEEVSGLLRRRKISPVEITRLCLDRIEKLNKTLNAFVTVTGVRAQGEAKTLEAEARAGKWRGPLHGVPIALKDLYDTALVRTTAASQQWAERVPTEDAEVVRRLKAGGAILLGKLNMDEFAYNYTGETSSFGTSRNPWNPERTPGGSSGGSAVALAAGLCYGTLGSDTGGSIRLPAALCGITGLKPTYGLISAAGVAPLAWSLDHVGPMCRTARDTAIMLEVLSGKPVRDSAVNVKTLRLGIPRAVFYESIEPEVAKSVSAATEVLSRITAGAREVVLPPLPPAPNVPDLPETYIRIIAAEAYAFHQQMLREHPDRYHAGTRKSIEMGAPVTAADYIRARREMERLRSNLEPWFAGADLLITPTAPGAAFRFGSGRLVFLRNTAPWNLLGLPAISIPCGFTSEGLPVGLQITGAAGRDDAVLALAAAYQRATDWHERRPPLPG
jgi:aspartyl-tRNA(Asn)/glutamyl-tRNA(Gln) amidotransferase subunit A